MLKNKTAKTAIDVLTEEQQFGIRPRAEIIYALDDLIEHSNCTGYTQVLTDRVQVAHDGDTCPIHEDSSESFEEYEATVAIKVFAASTQEATDFAWSIVNSIGKEPGTLDRATRRALSNYKSASVDRID